MTDETREQTLVLIKPDALKNSLTGYVISILSEYHTGLRFAGAKIVHVSRMLAEEHYAEHRGKVFYPSLIDYIMGRIHYANEPWKRRVIAFVYQGANAVKKLRDVAGPTNPHNARDQKPGCVRALGTVQTLKDEAGNAICERMDNLIHASANQDDAQREIKLWFKPNDMPPSMHVYPTRVCEDHYYYKNSRLYMSHEPDSACLLAPGDVAWQSDLDALREMHAGRSAACSIEAVAAKYLINEVQEE
jgi:nucleoside-diphosphate kinase